MKRVGKKHLLMPLFAHPERALVVFRNCYGDAEVKLIDLDGDDSLSCRMDLEDLEVMQENFNEFVAEYKAWIAERKAAEAKTAPATLPF